MVLSAHVQTPLFIVDCDRIRLVQLSRKMCGLTGAEPAAAFISFRNHRYWWYTNFWDKAR